MYTMDFLSEINNLILSFNLILFKRIIFFYTEFYQNISQHASIITGFHKFLGELNIP